METAIKIKNIIGSEALFKLGAEKMTGDDTYFGFQMRKCKHFTNVKIDIQPDEKYTVTFYRIKRKIEDKKQLIDVEEKNLIKVLEECSKIKFG